MGTLDQGPESKSVFTSKTVGANVVVAALLPVVLEKLDVKADAQTQLCILALINTFFRIISDKAVHIFKRKK